MVKTCHICGVTKPVDAFRTVTASKPGRKSWTGPSAKCRDCERARGKRQLTEPTECSKCHVVRDPEYFTAGQLVCRHCAAERARLRTPEYRRAEHERMAARLGKPRPRTRAEMKAIAAQRRRPSSMVYLRQLLGQLLNERCRAEGLNSYTVRYAAKWKASPAFRASERLRQQQYKHAHPETVARTGDRRKRRVAAQADGTLTPAVVRRLFAAADLCPYCAAQMERGDMALDHKEPISRGGAHTISNVVVCCRACNLEKRDLPYHTWLALVGARALVA